MGTRGETEVLPGKCCLSERTRWNLPYPLKRVHNQMKTTLLLGIGTMLLAVAGCNRESQSTQPQAPTNQNTGVFPGRAASVPAAPVSEWAKVKIDATGAVFVNKKQMPLEAFSSECARLKKVGGAVVLFIDSPNQVASPAQAESIRKIAEAGVPMKMAMNENEL